MARDGHPFVVPGPTRRAARRPARSSLTALLRFNCGMSLETALARIAELNSLIQGPGVAVPPGAQPASGAFAGQLQKAMGAGGAPRAGAASAPDGAGGGGSMVSIARGEVGQAEQPPGSNNSPRIAEYRKATAGAPGPGPWCAYFVSWVAKKAGMPIGPGGRGFGSVDALYAWAKGAGKAVPAGSARPRPGDLIVWDEHIGIVESVSGDTIKTIEGNSSDKVSRRTYGRGGGGAIGYVRMGR